MKCKFTMLVVLSALMLFPAFNGYSQTRKRVGVVLSGGGAKGMAHIGALKVLQEAGIPIDYIAGTSMGAIVGGLYSIGYDSQFLDSIARSVNWVELFTDKVPRQNMSFTQKQLADKYLVSVPLNIEKKLTLSGLMSGQNVLNLLSELTIGFHDPGKFSNLPIPFACMAYNMVDGKDVVLNGGDLPLSIRSSMSIPGVFEPVKMDGMVLIDGGVSNNFPTNIAKDEGMDIIIGIDVGAGVRNENQLNSFSDIFDQFTTFTGLANYERNKKLTTLYIRPTIEPYTAASFSPDAIDSLISRGEAATRAKWDQLMALKKEIGVPEDFKPKPIPLVPLADRVINIGNVSFEGLKFVKAVEVEKIAGLIPHSEISAEQLHSAISKLQGSGLFASVSYRIDEMAPYNITIMVKEYSRNSINLGLRFDTEEMAAILLNATVATKSRIMSEFSMTARLSENPYVQVGYRLGAPTQEQLSVSYKFKYNDTNLYRNGRKTSTLDYTYSEVDANFSNIRLRNFRALVGMRYEYYDFDNLFFDAVDNTNSAKSQGLISYYTNMMFDSFDEYYYPTKGLSALLGGDLVTSNFATYKGGAPFGVVKFKLGAALSVSKRVTFLPSVFGRVVIGNDIAYPYKNFIGGSVADRYLDSQSPFVGIRHIELTENSLMVARLDFRVRLWQKHYASLRGNYGVASDTAFDLADADHLWGAGIAYSYKSALGPIEILVDMSNGYKTPGFYFNFGYYF